MIDRGGEMRPFVKCARVFLAGVFGFALALGPVSARADVQQFTIVTVHVDGNTNVNGDAKHPAEPFPPQTLPDGGGLKLTPPDPKGDWSVRAFVFEPSQVVVHVGDEVQLDFVGVQGTLHRIRIDGVAGDIELRRGEMKRATLKPTKPGVIRFESRERLPSMRGQVVVLPR